MRKLIAAAVTILCAVSAAAEDWPTYLDYAYVYLSAEPDQLKARLAQYGKDAHIRLEDYVRKDFGPGAVNDGSDEETRLRRAAIAELLIYLSSGEPDHLDKSVDRVRELEDRLTRHENRYWYHTILAYHALERGQRFDFVAEMLDLWLNVVVPLETPYETLQTLSLGDTPNSGFVAALPYIYENVARMVLIRSQRMGVDRDLDPLGAIVRLLADGRVGAHPDVIPVALSSREYVERIASRLDGPESDVGSLTFTLALFEATKLHEQARALLAEKGFGEETVKAMRVASGAYEKALARASTLQGQATVYSRVLRQLGESYAARQRLGVDPDFETSFTIEGAIEVYDELYRAGKEGDFVSLGFLNRESYLLALHHLWEEIQETSLNAADYYLTRAAEKPALAHEMSRSAARVHSRLLAFFHTYATREARDAVPDSAYFAAYEAARGTGDALVAFAPADVTPAELALAVQRYVDALRLFPFERRGYVALTAALAKQGRESEYLDLARPVAESVTRSRQIEEWIDRKEPGANTVAAMRRALSDSQALVYLGFAESSNADALAAGVSDVKGKRAQLNSRLDALALKREEVARGGDVPASAADDAPSNLSEVELGEIAREIEDGKRELAKMDAQVSARTRALPLYQATLGGDDLADALRQRRDHPMHALLRRMYHEQRSLAEGDEK
jgi:ActR/RegA family two-component response regulator